MATCRTRNRRSGAVYITVLGTALIIALLGMTALIGQRLQNRIVVASADIRQAQLNAAAAMELGLLAMKQDTNWRTTYTNGNWFTNRGTSAGTCTLNVVDPIDNNLANNPDDPVIATGIGYSGQAEQRVKVTIDPRKEPIASLRSAFAAGDSISLQNNTLRTNGLISANSASATNAQVYGKVEAVSISGSTYNSTTTQINSAKRPTMPDWSTVFSYYRTNGTQILLGNIPSATPNLGKNTGIESGATDWTGSAIGMPTADISQSNNFVRTGSNSLRVQNRSAWNAGPEQYIDGFVKPNQQYTIDGYIYLPGLAIKNYRVSIFLKGTGGSVQSSFGSDTAIISGSWRPISATVTSPTWTGNLEYAFFKIAGADTNNTSDFYFDDLTVREAGTGKYIYRQVIAPGFNSLGGLNSEGIYWINCANNKIIIERSRILGTLLLVNPGPNSCISNGPISWSPAVPGYPALLVDADNASDADFSINATNRALSEKENGTNYNPAGAPHEDFGQDNDFVDIYRSSIRGLIAVEDDLSFQNLPLVRGQILFGDDTGTSSGELEIEYQPDSLLNPPPGFFAPYTYFRRPGTLQKVVLP